MRARRRLPSVQVPSGLSIRNEQCELETNLRLVAGLTDDVIICRTVRIRSADRHADLRQKVCSVLRRRDGVLAVPSPFRGSDVLVAQGDRFQIEKASGRGWHADLCDTGSPLKLGLDDSRHRAIVAELLQKSLVVGFERSLDYWRLSSSTRYWYEHSPEDTIDGIEMIPRVSFATVLAADSIGIAVDFGHLFRTEATLADFFDPSSNSRAGASEGASSIAFDHA